LQISFVDRSGDLSLAGHEMGGPSMRKPVSIGIPVQLSGIDQGEAIVFNDAKISLEGANGAHWISNWQGQGDTVLRSDSGEWPAEMMVPAKVFERFEGTRVKLQLNLAITEVKAGRVTQFNMPKPMNEIAVPDFGICVPEAGYFPDAVSLSCRFAWQAPFTYVSARWFNEPCAAAKSANDPGIEGDGWVGSVDRTMDWTFVPVAAPYMHFSNSMKYDQRSPELRYLCPDSLVTITHYERVRRAQESLTIPEIHLWNPDARH
jgi:hypothetical protein